MAPSINRSKVRLADIATEAGVSRAVVGKVLLGSGANIRVSPEKSKLILDIAKRLNYRPNQIARQLGGKSSQLIGVLTGASVSQGRLKTLLAVEAEARRRGYRILIGQISDTVVDVSRYLDEFESYNVDGVLYLDTREDISERLTHFPRAVSSLHLKGQDICYVELDRAQGSKLAVDHLLSRGRKKIGMVTGAKSTNVIRVEGEKERGFFQALASHGIKCGEEMIYRLPTDSPKSAEAVLPAVDYLVGKMKCDAIIAVRDMLAVYIRKGLRRRDLRVPEDVALIGFDNLDLSIATDPELTAVDHCHELRAKTMLDLLSRMKNDEEFIGGEAAGISISPALVVRQST